MESQTIKQTLRIAQRTEEAEDVVSLDLSSLDGTPLPEFTAGSHLDVHLGNKLTRQYSICSDPADRSRYTLGVLREQKSRGGSAFVHSELREGDLIEVGFPRNNFPCDESAAHSVLIAGGIGITPMLAMAYRLSAIGASYTLHYCCRTAARVAFRSLVTDGPFAKNTTVHINDEAPACRFSFYDEVGAPEPGVHVYVCGPAGFIEEVLSSARAMGWPEECLHSESFKANVMSEEGNSPVTVIAQRSNITIEVDADQSIASALVAAGIDIPLACEQGICGTCVTSVLEGEPLHRDDFLSEQEKKSNKVMTVCCSRAKSAHLMLDV